MPTDEDQLLSDDGADEGAAGDAAWRQAVQDDWQDDEAEEQPDVLGPLTDKIAHYLAELTAQNRDLAQRVAALEGQVETPDLIPDIFPILDHGDGTWDRADINATADAMDTVAGGLANTDATGFGKLLTLAGLNGEGVLAVRVRTRAGYRFVKVADGTSTFRIVYLILIDGSNGTRSTAATWIYGLQDENGDYILDTDGNPIINQSPLMARSIGKTQPAPDGSVGIAATIGGVLTLLIALGEYRGKAPCTGGA